MSAGYGRGFYGEDQLARSAKKRRSWFTIVAVLGVGATVVWLLWPRKNPAYDPYGLGPIGKAPPDRLLLPATTAITLPALQSLPAAAPQLSAIDTTGSALVAGATGAFLKQLEDDARARGFVAVKDYEDSVVTSAKQLQAAGAKVMLAPHLQHLAPQIS